MKEAPYPPGPQFILPYLWKLYTNPATALAALSRQFGDIVHFRFGGRSFVFFNHPAFIEVLEMDGPFFAPARLPRWAVAPSSLSLDETIHQALALTASHPLVADRLLAELAQAQREGASFAKDPARLLFTRSVLAETLRLYPPVAVVGGRAVDEYVMGGYHVPAGAVVLASSWAMQRDARYFAEPLIFRPERWEAHKATLPRLVFFPYGFNAPARALEERVWTLGVQMFAEKALRPALLSAAPRFLAHLY